MAGIQSIVRVLLRRILPLVLGLGVLIAVIAWLAGAFATKIQPGLQSPAAPDASQPPLAVARRITEEYEACSAA